MTINGIGRIKPIITEHGGPRVFDQSPPVHKSVLIYKHAGGKTDEDRPSSEASAEPHGPQAGLNTGIMYKVN
jgi:hypothetical protein